MEGITRRHFFHHADTEKQTPGITKEKADCHWCQIRAFPTHATHPITIINDIDDATLPSNFRFLQSSVLGEGVQAAEDSFRSGCDCTDDQDCQYGGCLCLQEQDDADGNDNDDEDEDDDEVAAGSGQREQGRKKIYRYHTHGAKAGLLRSEFLHEGGGSTQPLYECHEGCGCTARCPNRVVSRGRRVALQIFRTAHTGWGVRSLVDIRQGQFVDRYVGEVITPGEAQRRRDASAVARHKDVYLFALDKFTDERSPDARLRGPPLEIDGEFMSGPTRFVNHSCAPNLRIFARVGDHADKHIHDIAMFALRDIPRGEELTFDYVSGMVHEGDEKDEQKRDHMTRCLCGSDKCRGFLW
ncbi:hypothetical protein VD0002_g1221 [Verticillium dahliae]|uniref:Histone-lysine N-methyltransferase n=2 Tax=Verticillium dahliae TaxID=27337 RepID=G2XCE4_VERDV|nr:histone-lysine N-methyltransferase [Verticillium dahliae VdLs.17]KAH6706969.1 histone-lysine N-methyltransferase [Verticillium dahliae]EGY16662.1 histone-lysine N-methyltransferase [Verticillium dahliae VdLs.17]PNH31433.1 hypothetical protein BJF96_g5156 [Verticillium dahliae]PNH55179.1 hypothetical protein VD0003_g2411 [Verticillium dahliae]PNH69029.1 hypothetical protein VD0002_g1221 [Verticillium dahliae]